MNKFAWLTIALLWGCSSGGSDGGGGQGGAGAVGGAGGSGATAGQGGTGATGATGGSAGTAGSAGSAGAAGSGNPVVEITTNMGMMAIELDPVRMPITTANFLSYVDSGFYTDTIFHRVIPDFVIQGGGFTSGLNQKPTQPPITLETSPEITHEYGVISMARTTDPNSATSQFFVVNAAAGAHSLDGQYAAFGKLIEGSDVLDAISAVQTQTVGSYKDVPVTDVVIQSAKQR